MPASIVRAEELKRRYLREAVITATPAQRLNMLYDRLVLDLHQADEGVGRRDFKVANDRLCNAQSVLLALRGTLRIDLWDGARDLSRLYSVLHRELVEANLKKDQERVRRVRTVVEGLAAAWRQAGELEPDLSRDAPARVGA